MITCLCRRGFQEFLKQNNLWFFPGLKESFEQIVFNKNSQL